MSAIEDARAVLDAMPELNEQLHIVTRGNFTSVLTEHEVELRAALRALITEHERTITTASALRYAARSGLFGTNAHSTLLWLADEAEAREARVS